MGKDDGGDIGPPVREERGLREEAQGRHTRGGGGGRTRGSIVEEEAERRDVVWGRRRRRGSSRRRRRAVWRRLSGVGEEEAERSRGRGGRVTLWERMGTG